MALNVLTLFQEARNLGFTGSLTDVQDKINAIDRAHYEEIERSRYQIVLWKGETPLAGQPPEYWRNRGDWPEGGVVYCIYIDGALSIIQPHDPKSAGYIPMDEDTALARAQEFVDKLVEEAVDNIVKEQVLIGLLTQ